MERALSNDSLDPDESFLEGPLFKEASPLVPNLEVFDAALRRGAQAVGYREAAELLANTIIERPEYETSRTLLHPLLFLYRHSVELRLKWFIEDYGTGAPPTNHRLQCLWRTFRELATPHATTGDLDKTGKLIGELAEIDPDSQTFRYATTRNGKPIDIPFEAVDLLNLRKLMADLETFFFGLDAVIDEAQRNEN